MAAGRELDAEVAERKRTQRQAYIHSEQGKAIRRAYAERTRERWAARKRERRAKYAEANPQKVRARLLIGNAVRRGYMEAPSDERNWHNQWEFHHPDHARPYYGVWMRMNYYKAMHRGALECPPCIDYTSRVWARLHDEWGLP
jgi:hypothetical protein